MPLSVKNHLEKARRAGLFGAAEVLVAAGGDVVLHEKHGFGPGQKYFDLSSLTKPLATALTCLKAFEEGRLSPDDLVSDFFSTKTLGGVTVGELLNHTAPLIDWHDFARPYLRQAAPDQSRNTARILRKILTDSKLTRRVGGTLYSDLGYIVVGEILKKQYGKNLDRIVHDKVTGPLGLDKDLFYVPLGKRRARPSKGFIASETCVRRKRLIQGEVMDENSWVMGGVSGHAGFFGTALGIHGILTELNRARIGKSKHFSRAAFEIFCLPEAKRKFSERKFTFGFDTPTRPDSQSGKYFSKETIGHLGFSGTSFWWDMERDLWIILLTNRCLFGRAKGEFSRWRPRLHDELMKGFV